MHPEKDPELQVTNCSTIIIGKKASKTGKVLMAHNEDTPNVVVESHLVPRIKHKKGEVITFPDGTAVIPQVPETWAYYWSQCRAVGGEPFADSFLNEWGVAVASNSCVYDKTEEGTFTGIGYGLRRLIAERAKSARHGVEVAAELIETFGYRSTRAYHIADKNEAWVFQVVKGHNFAARRVGDDEVYYMPNWLSIHEIDFNDTKHEKFYWSKHIVDYAMEKGWYTPAKEGDYSDFDYAKAYQTADMFPSNMARSDLAWKQLAGRELPYKTFSIKAERKYGVEDLKPIMRSHYVEWEEDLKNDPTMSPHRFGLCRDTTCGTTIYEFNEIDELTCMWRAFPRPCGVPFVPWYAGITSIPKGYEWAGPLSSQISQFYVDEEEFHAHSGRAFAAFHLLENVMEFDYPAAAKIVHPEIEAMEKEFTVTKEAMDKMYKDLAKRNKKYAKAMLNDYTAAQAMKAWYWAKEAVLKIADAENAARMHFWRSKL